MRAFPSVGGRRGVAFPHYWYSHTNKLSPYSWTAHDSEICRIEMVNNPPGLISVDRQHVCKVFNTAGECYAIFKSHTSSVEGNGSAVGSSHSTHRPITGHNDAAIAGASFAVSIWPPPQILAKNMFLLQEGARLKRRVWSAAEGGMSVSDTTRATSRETRAPNPRDTTVFARAPNPRDTTVFVTQSQNSILSPSKKDPRISTTNLGVGFGEVDPLEDKYERISPEKPPGDKRPWDELAGESSAGEAGAAGTSTAPPPPPGGRKKRRKEEVRRLSTSSFAELLDHKVFSGQGAANRSQAANIRMGDRSRSLVDLRNEILQWGSNRQALHPADRHGGAPAPRPLVTEEFRYMRREFFGPKQTGQPFGRSEPRLLRLANERTDEFKRIAHAIMMG